MSNDVTSIAQMLQVVDSPTSNTIRIWQSHIKASSFYAQLFFLFHVRKCRSEVLVHDFSRVVRNDSLRIEHKNQTVI
ncbi:hypothetical protein AYX22_16765 [Arthrobacter sp. D5-1]|nr:hypothetical protein AYX22_16765 [Arthrobacter sp. D5-1]